MDIGIIADTHDNVAAVDSAVELFTEHAVETVLHCGDFIAPPIINRFDGFELHGVLGNNDGEVDGLSTAFSQLGNESQLHGRRATLEFDGYTFDILHGEDRDSVDAIAREERPDIVCYGHHHRNELTTVGGTYVCNPGGHFPTVPPEHQTVVIFDSASESFDFHRV